MNSNVDNSGMSGVMVWINALEERLTQPLPGERAHAAFRAVPDEVARNRYRHEGAPRPGSVLVLFFESGGEIYFPLILRSPYPGAHGGQVSFPGGKNEKDEDSIITALRETHEEIGVDSKGIRVLGSLTQYHIIPSHMLVQPVVGWMDNIPAFQPDQREVAKILQVSLTDLMEPESVGRTVVKAGEFSWEAPCFFLSGEVVWGATAMILNELKHVIAECHPHFRLP